MVNLIKINDIQIPVNIVRCSVRNCYLKFNNGFVTIKIPKRMPNIDSENAVNKLCNRFISRVSKDPDLIKSNNIFFNNGDITAPLGINFNIVMIKSENKNPSVLIKKNENSIIVKIPKDIEDIKVNKISSKLVFMGISKYLLPTIKSRIDMINGANFLSEINDVKLRYKETSWGSYSRRTKRITINTKLLYMPNDVINYVLIHELAHTKYGNHSKRFWNLVYTIMPNYKLHRNYLRKYGSKIQFKKVDIPIQKVL